MRLIDADAIKTIDYSGLTFIAPNDCKGIADYFYQQLIKNQPTAYDVEKVVEELELHKLNPYFAAYERKRINEAIEIVKGGGVDEN